MSYNNTYIYIYIIPLTNTSSNVPVCLKTTTSQQQSFKHQKVRLLSDYFVELKIIYIHKIIDHSYMIFVIIYILY